MYPVQERLILPPTGVEYAAWVTAFTREMARMWLEMAQKVNNGIAKVFYQSLEPTIPDNTMAVWVDADDGKFYLLARFSGTQKKVELT